MLLHLRICGRETNHRRPFYLALLGGKLSMVSLHVLPEIKHHQTTIYQWLLLPIFHCDSHRKSITQLYKICLTRHFPTLSPFSHMIVPRFPAFSHVSTPSRAVVRGRIRWCPSVEPSPSWGHNLRVVNGCANMDVSPKIGVSSNRGIVWISMV